MEVAEDDTLTVEEAVMAVRDAVALAKRENSDAAKKMAKNRAQEKAKNAVKLAVSQYIEELVEKEGSLSKIAKTLDTIDSEIRTGIPVENQNATNNSAYPSFEKILENWRQKTTEPKLINLCLLTQVRHVTYDYILGLDRMANTDRTTYGYTLGLFFYLFRNKKIGILRKTDFNFLEPVATVASKNGFNMTRYLVFKDKILQEMFEELSYQRQEDARKKGSENRNGYKETLRRLLIEYENTPLDSEAGKIHPPEDTRPLSGITQDSHPQKRYHGLPDDLADRLKSLPKKCGKNQAEFSEDACISASSFSELVPKKGTKKKQDKKGKNRFPSVSTLFLIAIAHGFSIDSILYADSPDKTEEPDQYKYTYGDTLYLIRHLLDTRTISRTLNFGYAPLAGNTSHTTNTTQIKASNGQSIHNMHYLNNNSQIAYPPGIYYIRDDFLLRLITEMEAIMSRPGNPPQNPYVSKISYEMAQADAKKFIARYNGEPLLNYQSGIAESLKEYSEKHFKHCDYSLNKSLIPSLDMSVDLDRMLKELRDVETKTSKALKDKATIKQDT